MFTNGMIYGMTSEVAENIYGEPVMESQSWSDGIPCLVKENHDSFNGSYEDGEFRSASYTVLLEERDFPYRRVKLSRFGEDLGEHRVINHSVLRKVGRVYLYLA